MQNFVRYVFNFVKVRFIEISRDFGLFVLRQSTKASSNKRAFIYQYLSENNDNLYYVYLILIFDFECAIYCVLNVEGYLLWTVVF